ncbi:MAG: hypothetical protein GSR84_05440 [Desulfurococcales archaeon]|nr:hypothetical protein [Desulfurococcales archaeon]
MAGGVFEIEEKFIDNINDLLETLEQFVEEKEHDTIIVVAPYDTGILRIIEKEYANNLASGGNVHVIDYLTLTATASILSQISNSLGGKKIVVLTPYQYRFLRANAGNLHKLGIVSGPDASNFVRNLLQSSETIYAYISPNTSDRDLRYVLRELMVTITRPSDSLLEKAFTRARYLTLSVEFNGEIKKTLAPYLALSIALNIVKPIPNSRLGALRDKFSKIKGHLVRAYDSLANFLVPALGLQPVVGGFLLGVIPLLYIVAQEQPVSSIARIPYYKLEELEEREQVPPGTFTMLGRHKNPLELLKPVIRLVQVIQGNVEDLNKKLESIQEKLNNIKDSLPRREQRELKKIILDIKDVRDEISRIWREIEELKLKLKELSQEYAVLPINTVEELIEKIDYHPGGYSRRLLDLRDQSKELRELIDKILDKTLEGKPIILTGPSGAGKTSLLILTAKQALEQGIPVYLLVARETHGAISLSDVETPYILVYDDIKPEQTVLLEWIIKNKETLSLIATARYHILKDLIQNVKTRAGSSGKATLRQEDVERFNANNILNLGLEKEYPRILLINLLNNYNIKYDDEAINIILEKSVQQYGNQPKGESRYKAGNLYYITLLVQYLHKKLPPENRILTKDIAQTAPTGLYSIVAREFLEALGLSIPPLGQIEIPFNLNTLARPLTDSPQETPITKCVKRATQNTLSSEEAFAKCFISYLIPRVALSHLGKRKIHPTLYREIQKTTTQLLGLNPDIIPDPQHLRGEAPHDSHLIFLRMDPLDPEVLEAKPLYTIIDGEKTITEWYYIRWIMIESYKIINKIIFNTIELEKAIIEHAPQATTTLLLDKVIQNIKPEQKYKNEKIIININNKKILYNLLIISDKQFSDALVEALKNGIDTSWPLAELAIERPELFKEYHIDTLIEALKNNINASWPLTKLATERPELFKEVCGSGVFECEFVYWLCRRFVFN